MTTTTTANLLHLDTDVQDMVLAARRAPVAAGQGMATYRELADRFGLVNPNAAMYACEQASRRQTGDHSLTIVHQRRVTRAVRFMVDRRFGIELECARGTMRSLPGDAIAGHHPVTTAAEHMRMQGLDAQPESYNHNTPSRWKVTYDATVSGVEAVSPILRGDAGLAEVVAACRGLKAAGAREGGGVHVHHDVTDFNQATLALLVTNLENVQGAMARYMPRGRRGSQWCAQMSGATFASVRHAVESGRLYIHNSGSRNTPSGWSCPVGRYYFFNFTSLGTYGTVEFRGHGASLNGAKLKTWVAVGAAIIEFSRLGHEFNGHQSADSMLTALTDAGLLSEQAARKFRERVTATSGSTGIHARSAYA